MVIIETQAGGEATATAHHPVIVMITRETTGLKGTAIEIPAEMTEPTKGRMIVAGRTRTNQRTLMEKTRRRTRKRRKRRRPPHLQGHLKR